MSRLILALLLLLPSLMPAGALPPASWSELPRWRGFNLLNRFSIDWSNRPFEERDFEQIAELGFNFVRLPIDYRCYIVGKDWEKYDEAVLKDIDQAVAWGRKHGIHVCLNLHRAPGYCINEPKEPRELWTDPKAQEVCAAHWALFAKRYRGIPGRELSFNLFNEPGNVKASDYALVVSRMTAAIRAEDPGRLILCDGLEYGKQPVPELIPLKVAQSGRGYQPFQLTHYKAPWVNGSTAWPEPQWPGLALNGFLYGADKQDLQAPVTLVGLFPRTTVLRIRVGTVSRLADLRFIADGKELGHQRLEPGPGKGAWTQAVYKDEWKIWQNVYDRDYSFLIPPGTQQALLKVGEGDWMTFTELGLAPMAAKGVTVTPVETVVKPGSTDWGRKPGSLAFTEGLALDPSRGGGDSAKALYEAQVAPWVRLKDQGVGVMVGEFGVFRMTPHAVALAWMEDCLKAWKGADMGWALWNFNGDFGILDSNRADVDYVDFHGRKLDAKMLELLKRY